MIGGIAVFIVPISNEISKSRCIDVDRKIYIRTNIDFQTARAVAKLRNEKYKKSGIFHLPEKEDFWDGKCAIVTLSDGDQNIIGAANANVCFAPFNGEEFYYYQYCKEGDCFEEELNGIKMDVIFEIFRVFTKDGHNNVLKYTPYVVRCLLNMIGSENYVDKKVGFLVCPIDINYKNAYIAYSKLANLNIHIMKSRNDIGSGRDLELIMLKMTG